MGQVEMSSFGNDNVIFNTNSSYFSKLIQSIQVKKGLLFGIGYKESIGKGQFTQRFFNDIIDKVNARFHSNDHAFF
jgi:hypothetical protein